MLDRLKNRFLEKPPKRTFSQENDLLRQAVAQYMKGEMDSETFKQTTANLCRIDLRRCAAKLKIR